MNYEFLISFHSVEFFGRHVYDLYTRYPIVARALGLAAECVARAKVSCIQVYDTSLPKTTNRSISTMPATEILDQIINRKATILYARYLCSRDALGLCSR